MSDVRKIKTGPDAIKFRPTEAAYDPVNAAVNIGGGQLNQLSMFLDDLPLYATADVLVAPFNTNIIFNRHLGTFDEDIANIRLIDASHGIHYNGQPLTGMKIYDRPDGAKYVPYEAVWASKVRRAWHQATASGIPVMTGLAIPTEQILHGSLYGRDNYCDFGNNVYARRDFLNAALAAQGGQLVVSSERRYMTRLTYHDVWNRTSAEEMSDPERVIMVNFWGGGIDLVTKGSNEDLIPSRPVALYIYPSPLLRL